MPYKRLYMITAIMVFLSAPLVFISDAGWTGGITGDFLSDFIIPALLVGVLLVISETILRHLGRSALLLRVISVLVSLRVLPYFVQYFILDYTPDTVNLLISVGLLLYIAIGMLLVCVYTILLIHLQSFSDPSLKLLKFYCTLRILGLLVFMFVHLAALFHFAAQITLGIMLLRYARQLYTPANISDVEVIPGTPY